MARKLIRYDQLRQATGYSRKTLSPLLNQPTAPARDPERWPEVLQFIREKMPGHTDDGEALSEVEKAKLAVIKLRADKLETAIRIDHLQIAKLEGEQISRADVGDMFAELGGVVGTLVSGFYSQAAVLFADKPAAEIESLAVPELERVRKALAGAAEKITPPDATEGPDRDAG